MRSIIIIFLLHPLLTFSDTLSIGVALNDLNNPFFSNILDGVVIAAEDNSIDRSTIRVVDSQYDVSLQIQQLNEFSQSGTDAVIITAADPIALQPHLKELVETGLHVVAVDVRAHGASATYHTHNVNAGRFACRYLADLLDGSGRLAIINGPGVTATVERVAGCEYFLMKESPNIEIVDKSVNGHGNEAGGYDAMRVLMNKYPDLNAVFAVNDPTAIGADKALLEANRYDIPIAAVDGSPAIIDIMKRNQTNIVSTSSQNPTLMGIRALEAIMQLDSGAEISTYNLIDTQLVTQDNLDSYSGW